MNEIRDEKIVYDQKESLEDDHELLFNYVKKQYGTLVNFLTEHVFQIYNEGEEFRGNTEFKNDYNLHSFDILLQYSILQLSLNDGKLIDERIEIVEGVATHASLPGIIATKLPNFDWMSFTSIKREEAYASLSLIYEQIGSVIRDFNQRLTMYKAVSGDTLLGFKASVKHFLEMIMCASGEFKEITAEDPCLILDLIDSEFEYYEEHAVDEK